MRIYDGRTEFYQYDTNQKLICDSCQVGEEIHFSNDFYSKAAICKTYELEGSIVVDVPNLYLLTPGELLVYLTHVDDGGRSTLKQYTFAVRERKRPSDYVYTETEVLSYHALESKFEALKSEVKKSTAGKKLPVNGGEIFNDYESNDSNIPYAHITGKNNKAVVKCFLVKSFTADTITLDSVEGILVGMPFNVFCTDKEEGYDKHRGVIQSVDSATNTVRLINYNNKPITDIDQWEGFAPSNEPTFLNTFICNGGTIGTDVINDVDFAYFCVTMTGENNIGYLNTHISGTGNKGLAFHAVIDGYKCEVWGEMGAAFNYRTKAGPEAFAINLQTEANGEASFAQGELTRADVYASSAFGIGTIVLCNAGMARGTWNEIDTEGKFLDIIGNGTGPSDRSNAYTLDKEGNVYFAGHVRTKGIYFGDDRNPYFGLRIREATTTLPVKGALRGDIFRLVARTPLIINKYGISSFGKRKYKTEEGVIFSESYADADSETRKNMVYYENLIKILDGGYEGFKISNGDSAAISPADITFKKPRKLFIQHDIWAINNNGYGYVLEANITGVKVDNDAQTIKFFGDWVNDGGIESNFQIPNGRREWFYTDNVYHDASELYKGEERNVKGTIHGDIFPAGSSVYRSEADGWMTLFGNYTTVDDVRALIAEVLKEKGIAP